MGLGVRMLIEEELTEKIIGAAIEVHRQLGPGLLESAYQTCFAHELRLRGLQIRTEVPLPVIYKGIRLDCGYRIDLLVENSVVVEVKSIERFERVHAAQLRSYLRLSGCKVGLLLNFNVKWLTAEGIKRVVHEFPE